PGSDGVAVAPGSSQANRQRPVLLADFVAQQSQLRSGAAVNHEIRIAVAVVIKNCEGAAVVGEVQSHCRRRIRKTSCPEIEEAYVTLTTIPRVSPVRQIERGGPSGPVFTAWRIGMGRKGHHL